MLFTLAGLFVLAQSADDPASVTFIPELTHRDRIADCLMPLGNEQIDQQVPVLCRVDARGRARDCSVPVDELAPSVRRAAICMAQAYTVRRSDGTDPVGQSTTVTIRIKTNTKAPR